MSVFVLPGSPGHFARVLQPPLAAQSTARQRGLRGPDSKRLRRTAGDTSWLARAFWLGQFLGVRQRTTQRRQATSRKAHSPDMFVSSLAQEPSAEAQKTQLKDLLLHSTSGDNIDCHDYEDEDGDPRLSPYIKRLHDHKGSGDCEGACKVLDDMWRNSIEPAFWIYDLAIEACHEANALEKVRRLRDEVRDLRDVVPGPIRFQLFPNLNWQRELKRAGCGAHNTLDWNGQLPLPLPESDACWLLPAQDDAAEVVARHQVELRQAGWRLLTSEPEVVARLRSKDKLFELAESLGLSAFMPQHYKTPAAALYPCIVKPSRGTWGKDTRIVYDAEEVLQTVHPSIEYEIDWRVDHEEQMHGVEFDWEEREEKRNRMLDEWYDKSEQEELGTKWVLQEFVPGRFEYSTTLLVHEGNILDVACSRYTFADTVYVWPALEYTGSEYVSVPKEHLAIMSAMLAGFSGICNFNYKIRPNGQMCIFEVNPRVGGDLTFDVPKKKVRALLEKMDSMFS